MSPLQLFLILKARWLAAVVTAMAVVSLTIAVTELLPKQYTASTSLLISPPTTDPITNALVSSGGTITTVIATELDVISSDRVLLNAARSAGLDRDASLNARWNRETKGQGDYLAWVASTLRRSLDLRPTRDSKVVSLSFTNISPEFAALMANTITEAYVATTTDLRVEQAKRYSEFFDLRTKETRDGLEAAQSRLSEFQRNAGVIIPDDRFDNESSKLAELSSQVLALQATVAESQNRERQAHTLSDSTQEVLSDPVVGDLASQLAREEAKLEETLARYGERHPAILEQRALIATLQKKIDAQTNKVTSSIGVNAAVNIGRLDAMKAALEEQKSRVLHMASLRDEAAVLKRDVENAQRSYDAILNKGSQTNLESQNTQPTVSILQNATPPPSPSSPKVALNIILGVVLGGLLGLGTAVVRELADRRIRCLTDIESINGIHVLGSIARCTQPHTLISRRIWTVFSQKMRLRKRGRHLSDLLIGH
ncbi:GNVR domain-containing protein [Derxia gummosa]|uniref:GNVR domain-containing protein n=1 Tax=Derxia gummosa DSM 723 TaxID=1121388 RepID=A0A8B6XAI2_9BURK|nr:GNVR domain-containing protein [Derxia gummosa]